jgi:hypothetical protein
MPVPFDTHAVIQELEHLGFPTPQAEGLSHVLTQIVASSDYATKADIAAVRSDIETLRVSTKADLSDTALRFDLKLEAMRSDIKLLQWGMGLVLSGMVSLLLKAFVLH